MVNIQIAVALRPINVTRLRGPIGVAQGWSLPVLSGWSAET